MAHKMRPPFDNHSFPPPHPHPHMPFDLAETGRLAHEILAPGALIANTMLFLLIAYYLWNKRLPWRRYLPTSALILNNAIYACTQIHPSRPINERGVTPLPLVDHASYVNGHLFFCVLICVQYVAVAHPLVYTLRLRKWHYGIVLPLTMTTGYGISVLFLTTLSIPNRENPIVCPWLHLGLEFSALVILTAGLLLTVMKTRQIAAFRRVNAALNQRIVFTYTLALELTVVLLCFGVISGCKVYPCYAGYTYVFNSTNASAHHNVTCFDDDDDDKAMHLPPPPPPPPSYYPPPHPPPHPPHHHHGHADQQIVFISLPVVGTVSLTFRLLRPLLIPLLYWYREGILRSFPMKVILAGIKLAGFSGRLLERVCLNRKDVSSSTSAARPVKMAQEENKQVLARPELQEIKNGNQAQQTKGVYVTSGQEGVKAGS